MASQLDHLEKAQLALWKLGFRSYSEVLEKMYESESDVILLGEMYRYRLDSTSGSYLLEFLNGSLVGFSCPIKNCKEFTGYGASCSHYKIEFDPNDVNVDMKELEKASKEASKALKEKTEYDLCESDKRNKIMSVLDSGNRNARDVLKGLVPRSFMIKDKLFLMSDHKNMYIVYNNLQTPICSVCASCEWGGITNGFFYCSEHYKKINKTLTSSHLHAPIRCGVYALFHEATRLQHSVMTKEALWKLLLDNIIGRNSQVKISTKLKSKIFVCNGEISISNRDINPHTTLRMCVHPFCLNLLYGVGNSKKYKELYATMGKHLCVDHMLLYELNDLKQYLSVVMPGQQMVADIPEDNN